MPEDDPARLELLSELRQLVVNIYGEERAAEATVRSILEAAASALWRVNQEPLGPAGDEP